MALEDMIEKCIEAGVTHFELHDVLEGSEGDRTSFHWDIYRGDPLKWANIALPWDLSFDWRGFGPHPRKLWGVLPFSVTVWPRWRIGLLTGGERNAWQMSERPTLEDGLRAALGNFLCEGRTLERPCPHEICEFHNTEYCEID